MFFRPQIAFRLFRSLFFFITKRIESLMKVCYELCAVRCQIVDFFSCIFTFTSALFAVAVLRNQM